MFTLGWVFHMMFILTVFQRTVILYQWKIITKLSCLAVNATIAEI